VIKRILLLIKNLLFFSITFIGYFFLYIIFIVFVPLTNTQANLLFLLWFIFYIFLVYLYMTLKSKLNKKTDFSAGSQ